MQKWKKYILLSDVVSLYLALILAILVRGLIHVHAQQTEAVWFAAHTLIFFPSFLFSLLTLYIAGLYDSKILFDRAKTLALLIYTQFATAVFSVISFYVLRTDLTPKLTLFFYVIFSIIFLSISRSYFFFKIQKLPKSKTIFFGKDKSLLDNIQPIYAPLVFEFSENKGEFEKKLGTEIFYLVYDEKELSVENSLFIEKVKNFGVSVFSYNQYYEFIYKKVDLENFYYDDFMRQIGNNKETSAHFLFRRFVDIFLGILVFPFFITSLPFIWLGIYLQDKGEIFSVQERIGFLGRIIKVYKIRTMTGNDIGRIVGENEDKEKHSRVGNVVTKFGKFLRKTRLDELPQCLNLFNGTISFIGPRASVLGVYNDMNANIENFSLRVLVPQGLTGWAQVHMNFAPRTYKEHTERLAYELYYIKYRSVLLDVAVILKTIKTLISREGS